MYLSLSLCIYMYVYIYIYIYINNFICTANNYILCLITRHLQPRKL